MWRALHGPPSGHLDERGARYSLHHPEERSQTGVAANQGERKQSNIREAIEVKIINLPIEQTLVEEALFSCVPPATPWSYSQTLEGHFELMRLP